MIAYFDCFSGISGDMTLGALIDLGVPVEWLEAALRKIPLSGFDLTTRSVSRKGIGAVRVIVDATDDKTSRDYAEIKSLIGGSALADNIKKLSLDIFEKLADAEAGIHGRPKDHVHFHEIGGIDAIVDIVGVTLCLEYLGIKTVVASKIRVGTGFVSCEHGKLPVPAPATLEILKGAPVQGAGTPHELVTPTGAAIVTTLADSFGYIPDMAVEKIGYGAGKRDLDPVPNVLRVVLGTPAEYQGDRIVVVETCIDDMNPEVFGFMMDRLFEDGALDVYWIPVFMKKNRPGTLVQVLCRQKQKEAVIKRILSESTSLGVRYYDVDRQMLARDSVNIKCVFGDVQVKRITRPDGTYAYTPEYEACKQIALEKNMPLKNVYDALLKDLASL